MFKTKICIRKEECSLTFISINLQYFRMESIILFDFRITKSDDTEKITKEPYDLALCYLNAIQLKHTFEVLVSRLESKNHY